MRAGRLLSILMLLQVHGRMTAEALAEACEVSVRTIYRDIEELSASGVPVYADRGPGGGFQLIDGYRTTLTGMGAAEAEAVFMIGMPSAADAMGLSQAATGAARKLLASLPPALSEGAGRLGSRFHLDPIDWYRGAAPTPHLPRLGRAVLDERIVEMTYDSWTTTRSWRVRPLGLVLKASAWYLVAASDEATLTFKVASIKELTLTEEQFERPVGFDLAEHWARETERFEHSLRPTSATILASPLGCERIARLGTYAARAVAEAPAPDVSGWTPITLPIENVEQAALLLLGQGSELEVLAPQELRLRIAEISRAVAARHHTAAEV